MLSKKEVLEVLLAKNIDQTTWNKRYKMLMEAVHMDAEVRKAVVNYMVRLAKGKDLSFGERKLFELASNYDAIMAEKMKNVIQIQEYINARR